MHAAMRGEEMQMWRLIGVVARCSCAAVPQSRPFQQLEAGMTAEDLWRSYAAECDVALACS